MAVDLSNLRRTVGAPDEALAIYRRELANHAALEVQAMLRDAVIQRFKFTFEVAWKTLKRYLEEYGLEQVDRMTNRQRFRLGYEQGLLRDAQAWLLYLQRRNLTGRVYSEPAAMQVFEIAPQFLDDAQSLLARLEEKLR